MSRIYKPLLIDMLKGRKLGNKIDKLIANQSMSRDEIKYYQNINIDALLKHSLETVPYYRDKYGPYRQGFSIADIEPLTKETVQRNPSLFVSEMFAKDKLRMGKTSGSTGKPLVFYYDDNLRAWNRAATARAISWWGLKYGNRSMRVWGMPNAGLENIKIRMIYLANNILCKNVARLTKNEVTDYLNLARFWHPEYMYGYTSGIFEIAMIALEGKISSIKSLKLAITTSEMIHEYQRVTIRNGLKCDVAQEYGVGESGIVAFECPQGHLHIYEDLVFLETTSEGVALITNLVNTAMPLLRYNTWDLLEIDKSEGACKIPFSKIKSLKGRNNEIIRFGDKTIHSQLFAHLAYEFISSRGNLVLDFNVVRTFENELKFVVVPGPTFDYKNVEQIIKLFVCKVLGEKMAIAVVPVDKLLRTPAGKIRFYSDERQVKNQ